MRLRLTVSKSRTKSAVAASTCVAALLLSPRLASAKDISSSQTLGAQADYDTLTVTATGVANVKQFDPVAAPMGGRLHIRANKIVVEEGGTITVSGAGAMGQEGQPGMGTGGGLVGMPDQPGGGAGAIGPGGQGTDSNCVLLGGLGGRPYMTTDIPDVFRTEYGSAGGAANDSGLTAGGRGGGLLILEANEIVIDGTIEAKGGNGAAGAGSGGGSGGIIYLRAFKFTFGASGLVSVQGGDGSQKMGGTDARNGGGGAGGLILFEAPDRGFDKYDIAGGLAGGCTEGVGQGAPGLFHKIAPPRESLDLDGDGTTVDDGDCYDVDPEIHPGAEEECDGVDNDCTGDPEDNCPTGQACVDTDAGGRKCELAAGSEDGGTNDVADELVVIGGCTVAERGTAAFAATVAAGLLALASRRRRR